MKVEVSQPKVIHQVVAQVFQMSDRYLPPTLLLGRINPVAGLFSEISSKLQVVYQDPVGYGVHLEACYFNRNDNFWSQDSVDGLVSIVQAASGLEHVLTRRDGFTIAEAQDFKNNVKFVTALGWEDERTGWFHQVREVDQTLRRELVTSQYSRERVEQELEHLLKNPTVLPKSERLYIAMIRFGAQVAEGDEDQQIDFEAEFGFVGKIKAFADYSQIMLNGMLKERGVEQHDVLQLIDPRENIIL